MVDYDTLEIVGFDEEIKARCGRVRVLMRDRKNGLYFFLPPNCSNLDGVLQMNWAEVQERFRGHSLTLLPQQDKNPEKPDNLLAIPAFPSAVALFVTQAFGDELKRTDEKLSGPDIKWFTIDGRIEESVVAYLTEKKAADLLERWAAGLRRRAVEQLLDFYRTKSVTSLETAEKALDFAWFASLSKTTRDEWFLLEAVVFMNGFRPERVANIYRAATARSPRWTWVAFMRQVEQMHDTLRVRCKPEPEVSSPLSPQTISKTFSRLRKILSARTGGSKEAPSEEAANILKFKEDVRIISKAPVAFQVQACVQAARQQSSRLEGLAEIRTSLLKKIRLNPNHSGIDLTAPEVVLLSTQPGAYCSGVVQFHPVLRLDLMQLTEADERFQTLNQNPGELVTEILYLLSSFV